MQNCYKSENFSRISHNLTEILIFEVSEQKTDLTKTEKGLEHRPEFFTNDSSRCPEYVCKISWISLDIYFHF